MEVRKSPSLLVAPWGLPFVWKDAEYYDAKNPENSLKSRTSLALLSRMMKPDATLILVPDTIASDERSGIDIGSIRGYEELEEAVINSVREWADEEGMLEEIVSQAEMRVLPNMGLYGGWRWEFTTERANPIMSYGALALTEILLALDGLAEKAQGDLDLMVDLTHGINYMPLATYRAARAAARTMSAVRRVNVKLTTFNSEPYPSSKSKDPRLAVYRVEEEVEVPGNSALWLADMLVAHGGAPYIRMREKPSGETAELISTSKQLTGGSLAVAAIVVYNLPLAAVYYSALEADEPRKTLELLCRSREVFEKETLMDNDEKLVLHEVSLSYEAGKALAAVYGLKSYLETASENAMEALDGKLSKLEEFGVELNELSLVAEKIGGSLAYVVGHELYEIERCIFDDRCEIIVSHDSWPNKPCGGLDDRNLVAHGGLERNVVEAKVEDGRILLRYRKNCWESRIKGMLTRLARKIVKVVH